MIGTEERSGTATSTEDGRARDSESGSAAEPMCRVRQLDSHSRERPSRLRRTEAPRCSRDVCEGSVELLRERVQALLLHVLCPVLLEDERSLRDRTDPDLHWTGDSRLS